MKCLRFISVVALFVCILATNSVHAAHRSTWTASARYARINHEIGRYTIVKHRFSGHSPGGGILRAYLLHGSPRKMVARYFGDSGEAVEEYYFWNNRLFFVLRAVLIDDEPSGKMKRIGEHRFYFNNGKLVRWQKGRKLMPLSSQEAKDYAESTVLMAREFLQTVRS